MPTAESIAERYREELRQKLRSRPQIAEREIDYRYKCDPNCEECRGSGFVIVVAKELDFRQVEVEVERTMICPRLDRESKILSSGLVEADLSLTWEKVMNVGDAKRAEEAVRETLARGFGWVYLWGGPGVAKTILLKAAVVDCLNQNTQAAYTNMSAILDNLREAYDTEHGQIESVARLERWSGIKVLTIDEFDRLKQTEYAKEKQFRLMDERYQSALRGQTITLMASNEPPETYDGYLADRIEDGRFRVVEMKGDSLRSSLDWTHKI